MLTRRQTLKAALATGVTGLVRGEADFPPVRCLTRPPGHHWFGYYDKLQFDKTDRLALGMRVRFEHRTPATEDELEIGLVDTGAGDAWRRLGSSSSWGWQQGCMLQWLPGDSGQVIWNDREDGQFISRVVDAHSLEQRVLPHPVYSVAPNGLWAITADFARIQALRPGYGYVGLEDPHADELVPEGTGVFRLDLMSGERELVVSIARMAALEPRSADMEGAKHYVNHLLVSPDGERIVFLHRWRPDGGRAGFRTRMLTSSPSGEDLYVLDPSGTTSHFIWRDGESLLAWSRPEGKPRGFYLFRDLSDEVSPVGEGVLTQDGHISYVPGHDGWLLTDTYPDRERREQRPMLFDEPTGRLVPLGRFHSPPEYRGEWRCDTHPRTSRDGRRVVIDSPHGGEGRQMWEIDVGAILDT